MSVETTIVQPVIEATRFVLRPVRASDQGPWAHFAQDARVARMTVSVPHPLPPGAAEAFVARCAVPGRSEQVWVMDASATGGSEFMGVITLEGMGQRQAEICYWVAPPFWNSGLASDAVQALVAANPLGCDTLFASVFQDNAASARVLVNCGFDYIGDAEAYCVARAATVPTWTYLRKLP